MRLTQLSVSKSAHGVTHPCVPATYDRLVAPTKARGDLAELAVATDLLRRGHSVAFPYGEDSDYDLILDREGQLERVQVKYGESRSGRLVVRCRSHSLTNGRVTATKRYTAAMIEWLAVHDGITGRCFYIPAYELGRGVNTMTLRLRPAANNQRRGIRMASDYERLNPIRDGDSAEMEPAGIEPATFALQTRRSPN